jgi:hypothetical protein
MGDTFIGKAPLDNYNYPLAAKASWWKGLEAKQVYICASANEIYLGPLLNKVFSLLGPHICLGLIPSLPILGYFYKEISTAMFRPSLLPGVQTFHTLIVIFHITLSLVISGCIRTELITLATDLFVTYSIMR